MTSGKADEEFFRQRGFGIRIGFGERPALIVIDMVKGFTDPAMPLGADLDGQIAAQKPLLEVAHERAIPVLFSTVIYEEVDQGCRYLGAQADRPAHAHLKLVVMAVPERIVALAIQFQILVFRKMRRVQPVRGRKAVSARHLYHAGSPK